MEANSLSDNSSLNAVTVAFVDPASDLHLVPALNAAVDGKATPIPTLITDFDNQTRDIAVPDLGADEIFAVLPVHIEFFRGRQQPGKNLLEWRASSTSPSVQFFIERSTDGRNFEVAGSISATLFNQVFAFYDVAPAARLNYYRIKMVEQDGSISYSAIISLASDVKDLAVSIRPGYIINGIANLVVRSEKATQLRVSVVDVSGKTVMQRLLTVPAGTGSYPIDVSLLASGVYYINVAGEERVSTEPIFVQ